MPEVDPEFIVHKLKVDLLFPSRKQKLRKSAKDHIEAVRQEVKRLKEAGAIKEVFFSEMACKYHGGKKEVWQMESLRRLH